MGLRHGTHCLACCWVLLLFVGGVMNLLWVAALSAIVLLQKIMPGGKHVAQASGLAMLAAGLYLVAKAALASRHRASSGFRRR